MPIIIQTSLQVSGHPAQYLVQGCKMFLTLVISFLPALGIRSGLKAEYSAALTAEIEMATGAPTHTADVRPGAEMISEMRPVLTDANDTESTSKFFV
jgi:hypothetical protein